MKRIRWLGWAGIGLALIGCSQGLFTGCGDSSRCYYYVQCRNGARLSIAGPCRGLLEEQARELCEGAGGIVNDDEGA
jgi:hypothetical protein